MASLVEQIGSIASSNVKRLIQRYRIYRYLNSRRIPWTTGYSEYKFHFLGTVINSNALAAFSNGRLPEKYGYRMDERVVEYPWFFSRLKDHESVILDAGSVLNFKDILLLEKLKNRRIYISTLFYEGRPDIKPSPSYIYEDLRDICFKEAFFDAICSLSTLEHIGFDNTMIYTPDTSKKENDKYAHLAAIKEFRRVLKNDGTLYLSMPFGKYKDHGWFQVFDTEMINGVIEAFHPSYLKKTFFRYHNDRWNFCAEKDCLDGYCFDIHKSKAYEPDFLAFSRCVVCLEMVK